MIVEAFVLIERLSSSVFLSLLDQFSRVRIGANQGSSHMVRVRVRDRVRVRVRVRVRIKAALTCL